MRLNYWVAGVAVLSAVCAAGEATMKAGMASFGKTTDRTEVEVFTLENAHGVRARLMTFGANLLSLEVPDKNGKIADVTLGFEKLDDYQKPYPYFGAIAGRFANRIAKGVFILDGKTYTLARNNGENSLHGGLKGFDKVVWKGELLPPLPHKGSVKFSYSSPDGDEGYPGNLNATVVYTLDDENQLTLDFTATTDKTTVLNLTNHTYWNLGGAAAGTILDHLMLINAQKYVPVDPAGIPTGELKDVKGTPLDFTTPHVIGERIEQMTGTPGGYDHTWVLDGKPGEMKLCATVSDLKSGRTLQVTTTEPGVQFYTGNFLDGSLTLRGGVVAVKHLGFCLETQHFPDSPNQPSFPTTLLKPGETYRQTTVFKFSAK
jgi:aldose 1-epimerase